MTDRRVILWLYLAIPVHYYWVYAEWYGMFIIFIPVYLFLFIPTRMLLVGETEGFIRSAARYHWAVGATVFCLSHIPYLLVLASSVHPAGGPVGLVIALLFLSQFNDVAQYVWCNTLSQRTLVHLITTH